MNGLAREITPVNIEKELKSSHPGYMVSVIAGCALPDVRDGLKPVHRRILYVMNVLGNDWNKAYKKSARIVDDAVGRYHPHNDTAVYDTIVRMAQLFFLHYMLVDGQGNLGSVGGNSAAAIRYMEICMSKIARELVADLEKKTVDFVDNHNGTEQTPDAIPAEIPNLLANGSSGIAVGVATNIPLHNLTEVINGCLAYIDDEDVSTEGLMEHIPGPDSPTATIVNSRRGVEEAYRIGRDKVYICVRTEVEADARTGRGIVIVHEIPYQINKICLIEKIAELVKDKRIEGISALRDGSDKDGMCIMIEVKRDAVGGVILSNLYPQTQLQVFFGISMVVLCHGQPKIANLKDITAALVRHRYEVVTRCIIFKLHKARDHMHVLEALAIALANIDPIIELIRRTPAPAEAKATLAVCSWELGNVSAMPEHVGDDVVRPEWLEPELGVRDGRCCLIEQQAQVTLDLRLQELTGFEHEKLLDEYKELLEQIAELLHILGSTDCLMEVIREEMELTREQFGDARRTEITTNSTDINIGGLISQEDIVVTLSHQDYTKYQPLIDYGAQHRDGKGKLVARIKEEDFINCLLAANTYDTILYFSNCGRLYQMKACQSPEANRDTCGRPIVNLLPSEASERIIAIPPVREYERSVNIFVATASGTVKKTALTELSHPHSAGIIAVNLSGGNELTGVDLTSGNDEVMLFSTAGKVVRFKEDAVHVMGRTATGVCGIKLAEKDSVVSLIVPCGEDVILAVIQNGHGRRTTAEEYSAKSRATQGVISIRVIEHNGSVVGAVQVEDTGQVMMITDADTLAYTRVSEVNMVGRNTQGMILICIAEDENVMGLQRVTESADGEEFDSIDGSVVEDDKDIVPKAESDDDATVSDADE